jgi:hypothetical protein
MIYTLMASMPVWAQEEDDSFIKLFFNLGVDAYEGPDSKGPPEDCGRESPGPQRDVV